MKPVIFVILCSIAVHAAVNERCEDGATWMMDCNTCTCMNGLPACTQMACMPGSSHIHKRNAGDLERCKEGTTWMIDCDMCTCMSGFPLCIKKPCSSHPDVHKRSLSEIRAKRSEELVVKPNSYKDNCKPGDTWKDEDCNRCRCDDIHSTVKAACTRRKCPGGEKLTPTLGWENMFNIDEQHGRKKRSKDYSIVKDDSYNFNCRLGDSWTSRDCNFCTCHKNGAACMANICPGGKRLTPTPGWENIYNIN